MARAPARRKSGPARRIGNGQVYASIALSSGAAEAAYRVKDVPEAQSYYMLWACAVAMAFGFLWGAFRLVTPPS